MYIPYCHLHYGLMAIKNNWNPSTFLTLFSFYVETWNCSCSFVLEVGRIAAQHAHLQQHERINAVLYVRANFTGASTSNLLTSKFEFLPLE